jgi:hypothetical protein
MIPNAGSGKTAELAAVFQKYCLEALKENRVFA